jgi:hypothetical protein
MAGKVASVNRKLFSGLLERTTHEVGRYSDPLCVEIDVRPGIREASQHFGVWNLNAHTFEDRQRRIMNPVDLILSQHTTQHTSPPIRADHRFGREVRSGRFGQKIVHPAAMFGPVPTDKLHPEILQKPAV